MSIGSRTLQGPKNNFKKHFMEIDLQDPVLVQARKRFKTFETAASFSSPAEIDSAIADIRADLKSVNADAAALDGTGATFAHEMERRFEAAVKRAHLLLAREQFAAFYKDNDSSSYDMEKNSVGIRANLEFSGGDIAEIDITKTLSVQQIEHALENKPYLQMAREKFIYLTCPKKHHSLEETQSTIDSIHSFLEKANANLAALDVTGTCSVEDIDRTIQKILQNEQGLPSEPPRKQPSSSQNCHTRWNELKYSLQECSPDS